MGTLKMVGGLVLNFFGMFITRDKNKRVVRNEQLKIILGEVRDNRKEMSVMGVAVCMLLTIALVVDLYTTGGANFDMFLQLIASWMVSGA